MTSQFNLHKTDDVIIDPPHDQLLSSSDVTGADYESANAFTKTTSQGIESVCHLQLLSKTCTNDDMVVVVMVVVVMVFMVLMEVVGVGGVSGVGCSVGGFVYGVGGGGAGDGGSDCGNGGFVMQ